MIGIDGAWVLQVDFGPIQDAIKAEDLEYLSLTEAAGTGLPTFKLRFATNDEKLTPYLNETTNLQITFGRSSDDVHSCNVYPTEIYVAKEGDNRRHVAMEGLLDYPEYLVNNVVGITDKKSAVEALTDLANRNQFAMDPDNISTSSDKQYWIQPNIPDKRFAGHLWLHASLPDSFPLVGITVIDEVFRIFDAKKKISSGNPDWTFTWNPTGAANEIAYHGNATMKNVTGFVNSWVGYSRKYLEYDAEAGTGAQFSVTVNPMLSQTHNMPTVGIDPRFGEVAMVSENVDPKFNQTYQRNLAYLAQFSCFGTKLQFVNDFQPIKVCDLAYLRDDSTEQPKRTASEYASGLFLVSEVSHVFTARRYTCSVQITREAPGDVQSSSATIAVN